MKQRPFLWFSLGLALLLAVLFRASFAPGMAQFSNDAPHGIMQAYSAIRWDYFFNGSWTDLNWLGGEALNTLPNFSHGLYLLGGAVFFAKFPALLSLLFFGAAAWVFARRLGFAPAVAALVGLAAA